MQIPTSKKKFVLYSEPRTGSSFLSLWLNNHPEIRSHAEVFLRAQPGQDKFEFYCRNHALRKVLYRVFLNRFTVDMNPGLQKNLIRGYLDKMFNDPTFSYPYKEGEDKTHYYPNPRFVTEKWVGFKLMRVQMEFYPVLRDWLQQDDLSIIYLHRENPLKQLISWYQLEQSGQAHSTEKFQAPKVTVDTNQLIKDLHAHQQNHQRNLQLIHRQPHLILSYEELTGDSQKTAQRMGDFLGIDFSETPLPSLQKVGKKDWTDAVTNAAEIKDALSQVEFARYL
ncbi:sulfotransferase [bacterium SCSIO 12741]|nr:sulfotransferase [bacterium SCSIO 12741]